MVALTLSSLLFLFNNNTVQYGTARKLPAHEERVTETLPEEKVLSSILPPSRKHKRLAPTSETGKETPETPFFPEPDVIEMPDTLSVADLPAPEHPVSKEELLYKFPPVQSDPSVFVVPSRKKTSLAFHVGSGGTLLAMNNPVPGNEDYFSYMKSGTVFMDEAASPSTARTTAEDFSDIKHHPPLAFGISFKKELNRTFSIESGLVYTFLTSEFKNESPLREASLQLHYLGIPLNLHTQILGNQHNQWGVYFSAGAMLEKGLFSHYSQQGSFNNADVNTAFWDKIDGLQWSLNAALGVEYKVIKNYSIYFEPKIEYYLKNNQPMSARTENPFTFGLNLGIRYSW